MALITTTPFTGTADNDIIVDFGGNAEPNSTLSGLGGNDLLLADQDWFFSNAGTNAGNALSLTSNTLPWSTALNSEITNSTTRPHATAVFTATAAVQAYYAVTVVAGQAITLDIDMTYGNTDTFVEILAPDGTTVIASNDDSLAGIDVGSVSSLDSFLNYTFLSSGTFYVRVREFGGNGNLEVGDQYVLNVSLSGQTVTNEQPIFGDDILVGGSGIDYLSGQSGADTFKIDPGDVVAGEYYNGGAGTDTIQATKTVNGSYTHDFSTSTVLSIEKVQYVDPGSGQSATIRFGANQLSADGLATNATIAFSGYSDVTDTLAFTMGSATSLNLGGLTFTGVSTTANGLDNVTVDGDGSSEAVIGSAIRDILNGNGGDDTLLGGAGNDLINGGDNNDTLRGDAGNDVIFGGNGFDTADYRYGFGATIDMTTGYVKDGEGGLDAVDQVEQFMGSLAYRDVFVGNGQVNYFAGFGGNDYVIAADGGADVFNGGDGFDTISYYYAQGSVVNLAAGTAIDGTTGFQQGSTDTIVDFEEVYGSGFYADTIIGNAVGNQLYGFGGNDILVGGGGPDSLFGGDGSDYFGFNAADFQAGVWDAVMDFSESAGNFDYLYFAGVNPSSLIFGSGNGGTYISTQALGGTGGIFVVGASQLMISDQLIFA